MNESLESLAPPLIIPPYRRHIKRTPYVGDVAAVVFAIQRWPLALCTGFAVYQINNTGGRIGCYFTDHPFGDLTSDHTCYNLYNNLDYKLFVAESQDMWLKWLDTECGQYYVWCLQWTGFSHLHL